MGKASQTKLVSVNRSIIAGLQAYWPEQTLVLAGKTWSTDDLVAALTGENDAIAATSSAKAAWLKATATLQAEALAAQALRAALHQYVLLRFGVDPVVLSAFGYKPPRKRGPSSPAARVIAAAKGLATRRARGTLGRKQRNAVYGALTTPQAFTVSVTPTAACPCRRPR